MRKASTPDSHSDELASPTGRVTRQVEARNTVRTADVPGAYDFVVEDDGEESSLGSLGVLASYIGAAACDHSFALGLGIQVDRVVVELETHVARSDGGTVSPDSGSTADLPSSRPRRVRALVEARSAESTSALGPWRDRLVSDRTPTSMVPELVGIDLLITTYDPDE